MMIGIDGSGGLHFDVAGLIKYGPEDNGNLSNPLVIKNIMQSVFDGKVIIEEIYVGDTLIKRSGSIISSENEDYHFSYFNGIFNHAFRMFRRKHTRIIKFSPYEDCK